MRPTNESLVTIADMSVRVVWHDELADLSRVLTRFPPTVAPPIATINLIAACDVHIAASVASKELTIAYPPDVDPDRGLLFEIGILQASSRFLALLLRSLNSPWTLLHGTTISLNNGVGIALLDDGYSLGKSSLAVALVQLRGKIVADEFAFVDTERLLATGGPAWPVHLRSDVAGVLLPTVFGSREVHVTPDRLGLPASNSTVLGAILFPRVGDHFSCRELPESDTLDRLVCASNDHIRKFCVPGADRVSILGHRTPSVDVVVAPWMNDRTHAVTMHIRARAIPFYEVTLGNPKELRSAASAIAAVLDPLGCNST
jgi:hypothetical protein